MEWKKKITENKISKADSCVTDEWLQTRYEAH